MRDYTALYQRGLAPPSGAFFEALIEAFYTLVLRKGDLAIDAGANVGRHTYPMARCVGETGVVYAFEPIPQLQEKLRQECVAAGLAQVRIMPVALGAGEGAASFNWVTHADGFSGLRERSMGEREKSSICQIDVSVTTLDQALSDRRGPIRFIKADLEGGEYDMFQGASAIMQADKPLIVFENGRQSAADLYGYDMSEWFALFRSRGYELADLFGRPFAEDQWSASSLPWYTFAIPAGGDIGTTDIDASIDLALAAG